MKLQHTLRASMGVAVAVATMTAAATSGTEAAAEPAAMDFESAILDGRIVYDEDQQSLDPSAARMTYGPDGVTWAAPGARQAVVDEKSNEEIIVPLVAESSGESARSGWSCTVYVDNPYKSGSGVVVKAEHICSGSYGTQRVRARIQLKTGISSFPWLSTSWATTSYTTNSYTSINKVTSCESGTFRQYRANGQGGVVLSWSPIVLSDIDPFISC